MLAAEQADQFVAHDADELLLRREALEHLLPHRLGFHRVEKTAHHFEVDVSFQQAETDLAQGVIDVALGDLALTAEPLKGQFKLIG